MADMKIADIDTLEKKSKKDLILLFFKKEFLISLIIRIKRYKSMSSIQRQELTLKKMKEKGINVGSGVPNKKYDSKEVYELIHIANCFSELREK